MDRGIWELRKKRTAPHSHPTRSCAVQLYLPACPFTLLIFIPLESTLEAEAWLKYRHLPSKCKALGSNPNTVAILRVFWSCVFP
jgi:hypothetical protein